jgi:hypothetical protein
MSKADGITYVDWEGELGIIKYDAEGYPVDTKVWRDGQWTPVHWAELLFKAREATPKQIARIKQLSTSEPSR